MTIDRRQFLTATAGGSAVVLVSSLCSRGQEQLRSDQLVHTTVPRNSEPHLDALVKEWMTPNELFYVRSHAPVPELDSNTFKLSVEGLVARPLTIQLNELRRDFTKHSAVCTLTCAGNRRSEHSRTKPVSGVPWQAGAIGNARWGGARLSDVLKKAGLGSSAKYVQFEGLDQIERTDTTIPFGASIPLDKALHDTADMPGTLLCYEMNGQPLSPDHGFPLRTIVPGFIGARSVKWLGRIVVSDRPSVNHYVATAYKLVEEGTAREWASQPALMQYPLNSVTCLPDANARLAAGEVEVRGYALAAGFGDRTVSKLELSGDGGKSWTSAEWTTPARPYCWRLWRSQLRIGPNTMSIVVRATDSQGNRQPESVPWNLKGYFYNAWHQTPVSVSG